MPSNKASRNKSGNFRLKVLVAAMSMVAASTAAATPSAATNSNAASASVATTLTNVQSLRAGETVIGPVASTRTMHVELALKLRNTAQLSSFLAVAQSPSVLIAQRTMSSQQFVANHAPTEAQAKAVAHYLTQAGFTHVHIAGNRMLVSADGTADVVQAAFGTHLSRVQAKDGREAFMNTSAPVIPAALQDSVLSVLGLQNVHRPHTFTKYKQSGLQPMSVTGHNPRDFSAIYGGTGVGTAAGVSVGIITQGAISQTITDLNTFTSNNGLQTVTTQTINTNGTSSDTAGLGEWNMDSQSIVGAAGGQVGKIIFYNIPTLSNANLTADINKIVSDNQVKVINVSLGECETDAQSDGSAAADDQSFQQATAQGQTFSVSSGDSGADECNNGGTTPSNPASSPYVVAVGGTTLSTSGSTWTGETVWNGTGGSPSTFEPKPSWQNNVVTGTKRGVPDIAFDADPSSGELVTVNGSSQQIGGTSLSAPIFAGLWARMLAAKGSSLGFAAPLIYQLPAADFRDVTSGSNGGYSAHAGWDYTTGFGSMIMNKVVSDLGGGNPPPPPPPPPPGSDTLQNGVAVTGLSAATNGDLNYTVVIPSGATNLVIATSGGSGDLDLYTKFGSVPTSSSYDCRPYKNGNNESCTVATPQAGTYYVRLHGYQAFSGASVMASWTGGGHPPPPPPGGSDLQNGVPLTGLSGSTGSQKFYTVTVPAGSALTISTSGGSGDVDMYVKQGSKPTTRSYDCRPYINGNNETCSGSNESGTYYIMLNGYRTYAGVSLKATW